MTCHRAFDVCRDPENALEELIRLGFTTLLTSGQAATVPEGVGLLRQLTKKSADRITIMPGCGITPANAAAMARAINCDWVHATAFRTLASPMRHRNDRVYMGVPGLPEYEREVTTEAAVRDLVHALRGIGVP